jgi:hypothetical protein
MWERNGELLEIKADSYLEREMKKILEICMKK